MDVASVSYIITIVLIFVDGIIFGVAASKGVASIILIVLGLILASFIGLSIPLAGTANNFVGGIENLATNTFNRYGPSFFAMPVLWIVGFLVGLFVV